MKYIVDDVSFETAKSALEGADYGLDIASDDRGIAFASIWTERSFEKKNGVIGGYLVGTLARNEPNFAQSFTLTMSEHLNDKNRMVRVLSSILSRKTMR
jgi:hypothetical protein